MKTMMALQRMPKIRAGLVLLLVWIMLAMSPAAARGGLVKPTGPQRVTGDTPLPINNDPSNPEICGSTRDHQGWENQPLVAVNPANHDHLIATWIQDWSDATVVGFSTDAGRSWTTAIPLTTECTWRMAHRDTDPAFAQYDDHNSINDPSVALGPDGVAYLTSAVSGRDVPGYVVVHRSLDGGRSWTDPQELDVADMASTGTVVDYTMVAADPYRPGTAYALWENGSAFGDRREQYVAKIHNSGQQRPAKVRVPTGNFPGFGQLVVLPDGRVLDIFLEVPPQPGLLPYKLVGPQAITSPLIGPTKLHVTTSADGFSWSQPRQIAEADPASVAHHRVTVAPDGTVYVFWLRADSSRTYSLRFISSTDGGVSWSESRQAGPPIDRPGTGNNGLTSPPNVAVAADGTLGVTFYDHRRDPGNSPPQVTDYWFRHSHDGGATWTEDRLAGPFNQSAAPDGNCCPPGSTDFEGAGNLGDGQGIVPIGNGFGTLFALAQPLDGANFDLASTREPTDLFYVRLKTTGRTE